MPGFWLDSNSFINPYRYYYGFDRVPKFWLFLEHQSKNRIIASPITVLDELEEGCKNKTPDVLLVWARNLKGTLFLEPNEVTQQIYGQIAEKVNNDNKSTYWRAEEFLRRADPWTIAYAKAFGGRVVTFEIPAPNATKAKIKIPDVADHFGIVCISLFKMLEELGARF